MARVNSRSLRFLFSRRMFCTQIYNSVDATYPPIRILKKRPAEDGCSHIIPVHYAQKAVYAQAVRYPTVEKNSARIRLSVTASMTLRQIHTISDAIESAGRFFKII